MTDKPTKLSDSALVILSGAAARDDRLADPPSKLPTAARNAVLGSLLKKGLVEEVAAPPNLADMAWRANQNGAAIAVRITDAGLRAIGIDPPPVANSAPQAASAAPVTDGIPVAGGSPQEHPASAMTGKSRKETVRLAAHRARHRLCAEHDLAVSRPSRHDL